MWGQTNMKRNTTHLGVAFSPNKNDSETVENYLVLFKTGSLQYPAIMSLLPLTISFAEGYFLEKPSTSSSLTERLDVKKEDALWSFQR